MSALAGSEFAEDAAKAAAAYKEKGDLRLFDTYLDHVFYKLDRAMVTASIAGHKEGRFNRHRFLQCSCT